MNKQIEKEEMASIITDAMLDGAENFVDCVVVAVERLVSNGYRKASDVVREIFEEIDTLCDKYPTIRTLGGKTFAELRKKYESEGADDE